MGAPTDCPHDNQPITTHGPYFRQVHPDNFQDGLALPRSFILQDTGCGCHFGLSLNDGVRTTAERCHCEYIQNSGRPSAAVFEVSKEELAKNGAFVIVDSPNEISFAHVDALYNQPMTRKQRDDARKALMAFANKRGPAYVPK